MNQRQTIWQIARWEFGRFFKMRQQLFSLVLGAVIGLASMGIGQWVKRSDKKPVKIAVMQSVTLALTPPLGSRLNFQSVTGRSEAQLREELNKKTWDGFLMAK